VPALPTLSVIRTSLFGVVLHDFVPVDAKTSEEIAQTVQGGLAVLSLPAFNPPQLQAILRALECNVQLVASNRRKADIVKELCQNNFRPFPKVAKAKAAGANKDAKEDEATAGPAAASGTSTDDDYLWCMAIWSLTKENVRMSSYATTDYSPRFTDRETASESCAQGPTIQPSAYGFGTIPHLLL
jgi:hypothetical protein